MGDDHVTVGERMGDQVRVGKLQEQCNGRGLVGYDIYAKPSRWASSLKVDC